MDINFAWAIWMVFINSHSFYQKTCFRNVIFMMDLAIRCHTLSKMAGLHPTFCNESSDITDYNRSFPGIISSCWNLGGTKPRKSSCAESKDEVRFSFGLWNWSGYSTRESSRCFFSKNQNQIRCISAVLWIFLRTVPHAFPDLQPLPIRNDHQNVIVYHTIHSFHAS